MVNYKQILTDLSQIMYHHEQIRSFGFGDITQITNDLNTKQEPKYIRSYIIPGEAIFNQYHIHQKFSIVIMDKVEDDLSNLKDVMSDTLEVAKDIWTVLYHSYQNQYGNFSWELTPDENPDILPFTEQYSTVVGGWTLNISIQIPFDYNACTPPVKFGYGFPQDQTFESWRVVVDDFQVFANLHEQIRSFGFGEIQQMTNDTITKQEPHYPRMFVQSDKVLVQSGHIHISWKVIFSDIIDDDLSNQQDVLNDTMEMAKDLFSKMYLSEYEADWDATLEPFLSWYETVLGGWVLNISMTQKSDYNRCVLPLTSFEQGITWEELAELWRLEAQRWDDVKKQP
jgi:hypothetical protein